MHTVLTAVLSTALILSAPAAAPAQPVSSAHFLDCSRRDAGVGTSRSPWRTPAEASQHRFQPGDRLFVRRGTTCHGQLAPLGSGTAAQRIVIDAYGKGAAPTIAGGGTVSWRGAVQLTDQEYWTVRNLRVTNTDGRAVSLFYRSGVLVLNQTGRHLRGIRVERLTVTDVVSNMNTVWAGPRSFGGISVITTGSGGSGFTDLLVRSNVVQHVGRTGIVVSNNSYPVGADRRVRITANRVERVRGDGILLLGSKGGRIDHNVSAHAAQEWPCPDCGPISRFTANAAIWTGASDRVRIDHNEAYGTKYLGGDGEGFDVDSGSTNAVVEYNYAHDNEGGGILFCGSKHAVARFNVLKDNRKSAIAFIGSAPATDTTIHNNTIISGQRTNAANVRTFNGLKGQGIRFFNNLVINEGKSGWTFPTKVSARSNTILGRKGHAEPHGPRFSRVSPRLSSSSSVTAGFVSLRGYTPTRMSAPRGSPISSTVTRDILGHRLDPRRPPRGAVESPSAVPRAG